MAYGTATLPAEYRAIAQLHAGGEPAGYVAEAGGTAPEQVVVFCGTGTSLRWYDDLDVAFEAFAGGRVCAGYLRRYETLRGLDAIRAPYVLVGHGIGGALATVHVMAVAAARRPLPREVYTFGSPRVGDAAFVAGYDALGTATWRIANHRDLTQRIPAADYGLEHVAAGIRVDSLGRAPLDHGGTHAMRTYLRLLEAGTSGP